MNPLISGLIFLVRIVFDLYIFILMLRFIMQKRYANYYNPITQLIIKTTEPILKPLRRVIPGYKGYDFSICFLFLVLQIIELVLLIWFGDGLFPKILGTLIMTIGELGNKFINLFVFAIIIQAIMSWVPTLKNNPFSEIVYIVCAPVMNLAQRFIPTIGGIDFSPMVVIVLLFLISIVLFKPIYQYGGLLALTP